MFGNVIGDRVDAADNESEWDSLLLYLGKSIDAWCGLPRVQSVREQSITLSFSKF